MIRKVKNTSVLVARSTHLYSFLHDFRNFQLKTVILKKKLSTNHQIHWKYIALFAQSVTQIQDI